ncbi:MAG: TRAM domain-containing protein, partial [Candidatus Aminicenantes bacterium]|nr:TRAM domain-containing protein [Candidatus Aminicenantes bacterium]
IFSFIYSPRPGTKAATYTRELAPGAVKQRLYALQELQARIQLKNNRRWLGKVIEVLITEKHPKKTGEVIGRSESYRVVNFASRTAIGAFTRVKVTAVGPHSMRGEEILKSVDA